MLRFVVRLQQAWATRGPLARVLWPVAALYAALTSLRRTLYRIGWLRTERLPVRVIVVGNLIAGGAGKTPTVLALAAMLRRHGWAPAIVSRGYGGSRSGVIAVHADTPASLCGDEPLLVHLRARVPVFVGRDRVGAARALLHAHPEIDVVISDDGLQHLRLGRDLQVLVFDERGAGNGWLLPAGPLREALPRAVPPHSLVLYNSAQATTALPGSLAQRQLGGAVALDAWWRGAPARREILDALRGQRIVAAAGIARPERFFALLRETGLEIEALALADHCSYAVLPWPPGSADVVVTEKDAVKLDPARMHGTRVWVAALDFVPAPAFDAQVLRMLGPAPTPATASAHGNPTA